MHAKVSCRQAGPEQRGEAESSVYNTFWSQEKKAFFLTVRTK